MKKLFQKNISFLSFQPLIFMKLRQIDRNKKTLLIQSNMSHEFCWNGVFGPKYPYHSFSNAPLWKLVLKSDHFAEFDISLLVPKSINRHDIESVECLLLDKKFDVNNVEVHTDSSFAPWLDDIQHNTRKRNRLINYNNYKNCNEWKFSFEFDFKQTGIYHTLFHSTNNKNKSRFNFDTNTMKKQDFIQQCHIYNISNKDWRQKTKKIDIIQKNEIIFKLKIKIAHLFNTYDYNRTRLFREWMDKDINDINDTIENDMLILNYSTNNVFIGFNSLMLHYENIRCIITDIFIVQSGNCGVENSIIDILFKYISFVAIDTDNNYTGVKNDKDCHFAIGHNYKNGRMSLKKYGFNRCENGQERKTTSSSLKFETKNKIITSHYRRDDYYYYNQPYYFESCILKDKQLNVIFNNWINVNEYRLYHNIIDKKTKKTLIIPECANSEYYWEENEYFVSKVQRLCHGHKCINFEYNLNKCIKNEWILNRDYLVRCLFLGNSITYCYN